MSTRTIILKNASCGDTVSTDDKLSHYLIFIDLCMSTAMTIRNPQEKIIKTLWAEDSNQNYCQQRE